jgi:hypothetical protein
MVLSFSSRQVLQTNDLVFIASHRTTSAVLTVLVDKVVPFRFRSTFTAAPLHFNLIDRQPAVFWRNIVGEIGFNSTTLLDAFPDSATADRFDGIFSDEAVGTRLWINALWALTDLFKATVGRTSDGDRVESFWSSTNFVWDDLTLASSGGTTNSSDFRKDFLIGIAISIVSNRWAFADLLSAAVGGANNWNGLEDLW